jgi:hypothetical protein
MGFFGGVWGGGGVVVCRIAQGWPTSTHWRVTQDLPEGRIYLYIHRKRGGCMIELTRTPLFTNTFVGLLFIKVAILCSVGLLYYVC